MVRTTLAATLLSATALMLSSPAFAQAPAQPSPGGVSSPSDSGKPVDMSSQPDAKAVAAPGTLAASTPHYTPPANICTELVAFLTPKPAPADAAAPAPGAAPAAPPPANAAPPAGAQNAAPPQAATGQPAEKISAQATDAQKNGGSAQQASAQSGVAAEAPKSDAPAATGSGQNAPQTSGQSAPIPQSADKKVTPSVPLPVAQDMAQANDIAGCRTAAQKMRREGATLPNPLIALAALDMRFLQNAAPAAAPVTPPAPAQ